MHSMASDSPSRKWKQSNPHRHAMAFVKGKFPTHTSWFIQVILWEQKRNPSRLLHRIDRTNRYILASVRWWISGPTVRYATGHPFPVDPVEAIRCTYVKCFCFFHVGGNLKCLYARLVFLRQRCYYLSGYTTTRPLSSRVARGTFWSHLNLFPWVTPQNLYKPPRNSIHSFFSPSFDSVFSKAVFSLIARRRRSPKIRFPFFTWIFFFFKFKIRNWHSTRRCVLLYYSRPDAETGVVNIPRGGEERVRSVRIVFYDRFFI